MLGHVLDRFLRHVGTGAHDDHHALGVGCAHVFVELVLASGQLGELIHRVLHDGRRRIVERIDGLAPLEVNVWVLRRSAKDRLIRRQSARPVLVHQVVRHHRLQIVHRELLDLGDFVRSAEAVEEVNEGYAGFQRGGLRDQREVHHFLHVVAAQQRPPGLADGVDVLVIAKDRKPLRGDGARGNVHHRRRQFAGNLVHVRDHQQQALRGRERRSQRAALQCAMECPSRSGLTLHLDHERNCAPYIRLAVRRPLIRPLAHWGGWRDRINGDDFVDFMCNVCRRLVSVDRNFRSSAHFDKSIRFEIMLAPGGSRRRKENICDGFTIKLTPAYHRGL